MRIHNSEPTIFYHCSLNFNQVKQQFKPLKKADVFLLISILLCSTVLASQFVGLVNAQADSTVTITSKGHVVGTDRIERKDDVYTFTRDIFGIIVVEKDDITLDGAGYAIKGKGSGVDLNRNSNGPSQPGCGRVVVKNVRFCDKGRIFASSNNNSFTNNTFEGGGINIRCGTGYGSSGNIITHNVFIDCYEAISIDWATINLVVENNFVNCGISYFIYGWLEFDRNYWSDYELLYSDAREIGATGIWDTPYSYKRGSNLPFVDSNPLVNPVAGAGAPEINKKSTPIPTTATLENNPESFSTNILIISIVIVVMASIGLLVYFKRQKQC
jgi:hypothetical protein